MDRASILKAVDYKTALAQAIEGLATHAVPGSLICFEYGCHIGAPDPDAVDPRSADGLVPEFTNFLKARAAELVSAKVNELARRIDENDGAICLYRGLYVDRRWLDGNIGSRPIGIHWTWDYNFAIAYHGEPVIGGTPIDVRVIGLVRAEDVDWTSTVSLAASELYCTGEEREIRLRPEALVEIAGIDWRPAAIDGDDAPYAPDPGFETSGLIVGAGSAAATQLSRRTSPT